MKTFKFGPTIARPAFCTHIQNSIFLMEIVRRKKVTRTSLNKKDASAEPRTRRRTAVCLELSTRHLYRRAFSESTLLDTLGSFDFKEGSSYHFITAGDVDSLSYLKAILRAQNCEHVLLSTWCMAAEDILQLQQWISEGRIKKLDIYVGEIFPNSYKIEYQMLCEMYADNGQGAGGGELPCFATTQKYSQASAISLPLASRPALT